MAIAMPKVASNLCVLKTGREPGTGVKAGTLTGENWITVLLPFHTQGFDCSDRVGVQVNSAVRTVLRLGQLNGALVEVHLRPTTAVLLCQSHPGFDADHELGKVFGEALADDLVKTTVLVFGKVTSPPLRFFSVVHVASWVGSYVPVFHPSSVTEGEERSVAVPCGCRFAMGTEPLLYVLRLDVGS